MRIYARNADDLTVWLSNGKLRRSNSMVKLLLSRCGVIERATERLALKIIPLTAPTRLVQRRPPHSNGNPPLRDNAAHK